MTDHIRSGSGDPYCHICTWQKVEFEKWEWDVETYEDSNYDVTLTLNVRFVWKCPECGEKVTKYTPVGHLV
jgi:hypothetical protein